MDFGTISGGVAVLVLVDMWTRYTEAIPLKKTTRNVADAVLSFLGRVGQVEKVELVCDQEKVLLAGLELAKETRTRMGLATTLDMNKAFDKSKTAAAERYIQTIRNQAKALILHLETKAGVYFDPERAIHSWAARHSAWLLNRYAVHSTLKTTPFQALHGRPYGERICAFGSTVFALDEHKSKYERRWLRGIWLGKDRADQDIVAFEDSRLVRTRAVRLCAKEFEKELLIGLEILPDSMKKAATHGSMKVKLRDLPSPEVLPFKVMDAEAKEAMDYHEAHPDSDEEYTPSVGGRADDREAQDESASKKARTDDGPGRGSNEPMDASDAVEDKKHGLEDKEEQPPKHYKHSEETTERSPKRRELHSPTWAGNINMVEENDDMYVDEQIDLLEAWTFDLEHHPELEVEMDTDEKSFGDRAERDGPPNVSEEEPNELDRKATLEEISRLQQLEVLAGAEEATDEEPLLLDTTCVFDWRFRGMWKRRCQIVAREYRTGNTDENQFSPTPAGFTRRLILVCGKLFNLCLFVADIKDAFLSVKQRELAEVIVPSWVRDLAQGEQANNPLLTAERWKLLKCLPGQRNAALRWSEHFKELVEKMNFESYNGMPTVFKHSTRKMFLMIHVDDVLVASGIEDWTWFRTARW